MLGARSGGGALDGTEPRGWFRAASQRALVEALLAPTCNSCIQNGSPTVRLTLKIVRLAKCILGLPGLLFEIRQFEDADQLDTVLTAQ